MASIFTKNQNVRLKQPAVQGPVSNFRMNDQGEIMCFVSWTDQDGKQQQRWFKESNLEAVE
jgi:hypothetical protein